MRIFFIILLLFLSIQIQFGQDNKFIVDQFIKEHIDQLGVEENDLKDYVITDNYRSENLNLSHVYIRQTFLGIEIYKAQANFNIRESQVISVGNRLIQSISTKVNQTAPHINPQEAIVKAAQQLGIQHESVIDLLEVKDKKYIFRANALSLEDIKVQLMFQPTDNGKLVLCWDLDIYQLDKKHWWSVRVDAQSGKIIDKLDWVVSCDFSHCNHKHGHTKRPIPNEEDEMPMPPTTDQYRVFPIPVESPIYGGRSLLVGPYNALASPFGWHDTNGVAGAEYTITRGNNVYATEDANGDNTAGYAPNGTNSLNFDFPLNLNQQPSGYQDAAITNLFYMNNIMHDIWYNHGFDDQSGNFQENNYGRGGTGNDGVIADAQDGSGTNNANFATPAEGTRPRMQMYLWTNGLAYLLTVNSPTNLSGQYAAIPAGFGPAIPTTPITSNFVLMTDATTDFYDGCDALTNAAAISGKIAVVRRGTCNFVAKVQAAQNAGAIAVIVVNNAAGAPIVMGGTSTTINIPSLMISQADGDPIINALIAGTTVNGTIVDNGSNYDLDGDFDNGVIAHEYGHGISTRLTGGPANSNCLGGDEQMGEGWSDWFGLMLTIEPGDTATNARGIGNYVSGQPTNGGGIRPAPYSTSFAVNNYTYANTNNTALTVPHGVGFVWCTMLWDLSWAFINRYGYDSNLYTGNGGNNKIMKLVIAALKLQPCDPGFVDGRDAILLADSILYNGVNRCMIWEVFARRGLGFSANQGSSASRADQTEAFDLPPLCIVPTVPPVAQFGSFANCSGLVSFRDSSTLSPNSWSWSFGDGDTSQLQNPVHQYLQSGTYVVRFIVGNQVGFDTLFQNIVINLPPSPQVANVNICQGQPTTLSATATGTIEWFDSTGTQLLGTGSSFTTPPLFNNATYRVQNTISPVSQYVGPVNTSIGTNANHNQATVFTLNFTALQAFTLKSVWVNASTVGNRTINIYNGPNGTGTVVSTVVVNITATGAQRINLNLSIPSAGTYSIGGVNMNMFRNNAGVVYPYTLAQVTSITGSSAGAGFYYYFYNWEVQTAACKSAKQPVTVTVKAIQNQITTQNVVCSQNGQAQVISQGSIAPYQYIWSQGNTNAVVTALTTGVYTVTTTDAIGCVNIDTVSITDQSVVLQWQAQILNDLCNQNSGSIEIQVNNGVAPYNYTWSNSVQSSLNGTLTAGNYQVTITDSNGCLGVDSFNILAVPGPSIFMQTNALSCFNSSDGAILPVISGANGSLSYLWSTGESSSSIQQLGSGSYSLTVTDSLGCTANSSAIISAPGILIDSSFIIQETVAGAADGVIETYMSGGTAPYIYLWSNGASTSMIQQLTAGIYTVTVTDANGCTASFIYEILSLPTSVVMESPGKFILYPNPAETFIYLYLEGNSAVYSVRIFNVLGNCLLSGEMHEPTLVIPVQEWASGHYFIQIQGANKNETLIFEKK